MAGVFYFPLIGTPTAIGNLLSFYEAGTVIPLDVWTDTDLQIPWSQPIVLNAAGESDGPIYVSDSPAYKVVYTDADGVAIPGYPVDGVSPSTIVNVMTTATVTLTNAQIKALPTTGITIVTAPSSGLRVKPLAATLKAVIVGAYTNINTTSAALTIEVNSDTWLTVGVINDSTTTPHLTMVTDLLAATGTWVMDLPTPLALVPVTTTKGWVIPQIAVGSTAFDGVAATLMFDNNGSGNLTGGNASNSLTVTFYYALESLA